ncbi:aspartate kinase [Moheibacter sediminis]|uniref:Aspartokinase n=1 Tax=Moheibacter sediminis TaxID=1434700 RepID=A0A1W2C8A0_9FLAO|nr:aspartate kinase [Moheibacter sediminis]SMC81475.1 aspartate kinase [Moheibacter sediminis]
MKVFKFGGASVKDANSVKNLAEVLKTAGYKNTFLVISAMGKTTNALEEVVKLYFEKADFTSKVISIQQQHIAIAEELFENSEEIKKEIYIFFEDLNAFLRRNKSPNYDFVYDQVVCCGELISTKIVSAYLNSIEVKNTWLDVRDFIKTDDTYREGKVNWELTEENFSRLQKNEFYVTQGFLGSDANFFTTTLGREGSDYTAAIIAYCLNAEGMTIWKDVPGVLNADPRYFKDTQLLNKISYEEAIELAYYGASVIHPKTMQPLRSKEIPFYVKSFINPKENGTQIGKGQLLEPFIPCFIIKKEQHLITLTTLDFSFITEDKISAIFNLLHDLKIKVNMMQNSAITLSLCVEDKYTQLDLFLEEIKNLYKVDLEKNVSLYTLRHFDEKSEATIHSGQELLRQIIKNTLQIIVKE